MTEPRDSDRLIGAFLADGRTELPDRAYDAVRARIDRTRQRVVIGPWREPRMTNVVRLAIGAAAVLIVGVVGLRLVASGLTGDTGAVPSPSAIVSPSPTATVSPPRAKAYEWPMPLEPGTYTTSFVWDPGLVFTFTVREGWQSRDLGVVKGDRMAVQFLLVDNVVTDVCGETLRAPKIGQTVDDLVAALSTLVNVDTGPTPVSMRGRSGTYLEYTVRPDVRCTSSQFRLMRLPAFICGKGCGGVGAPWKGLELGVEERNRLWILGVGRGRVVIDALWTPDATPADLTELQGVIDSVQLAIPGATLPPQPASP